MHQHLSKNSRAKFSNISPSKWINDQVVGSLLLLVSELYKISMVISVRFCGKLNKWYCHSQLVIKSLWIWLHTIFFSKSDWNGCIQVSKLKWSCARIYLLSSKNGSSSKPNLDCLIINSTDRLLRLIQHC